jgi:hypothetical protein
MKTDILIACFLLGVVGCGESPVSTSSNGEHHDQVVSNSFIGTWANLKIPGDSIVFSDSIFYTFLADFGPLDTMSRGQYSIVADTVMICNVECYFYKYLNRNDTIFYLEPYLDTVKTPYRIISITEKVDTVPQWAKPF